METQSKERWMAFGLWVGLVELTLLITQRMPESIFVHPPVGPTIAAGVIFFAMGVYGYLEDRLTLAKAIWAVITLLAIFGVPNIMRALMGLSW